MPVDPDGNLVGAGDRVAQTRQVLANLETQLSAAGASPADVVKTVVYVVADRSEDLSAVWDVVRASPFSGAASTLVGVTFLGYTGQLVEVEAGRRNRLAHQLFRALGPLPGLPMSPGTCFT